MARPRAAAAQGLPQNLYIMRGDYYVYRNKVDGKNRGLGKDREAAIRFATRMNESMGITTEDSPKGVGLNIGTLLGSDYIMDFARPVKTTCGIYFLIHERQIVYVGQSTNCHMRIGNHLNDPQKIFDSYFVIECKEHFLDDLESSYIIKFQPKYNLIIPKVRKEIARFMALVENLRSEVQKVD